MTRFVFITGGVVSSLGKGIASAALGALRERAQGRLHFAHADLAGYSVFEEAFTQGETVAARLLKSDRAGR